MKTLVPLLLAFLLLASACNDHRCSTPIGDAACSIDISLPSYSSLSTVGGYAYLVGGYKGIFVVRTSYGEFSAYERACPHDHDVAVEVDSVWGSALLTCPTCGSRFNVYADGMPIDGSLTQCPLNQYSTTFNGITLTIW